MNKMEQKTLIHIELLRVLSLLCVILFHSIGMLYSKFPMAESTLEGSIIKQISSLLVGIAVALFMFIAGYLHKPIKRSDIGLFIKKKAMRLLIPYVLFTILIMLSSGYFSIKNLFGGGFYHLWFLTALFWCFIISIFIDYSSKIIYFILPVSIACSMIRIPEFLGIQDFIQWYYYFALGAIIKSHPNILNAIKRYYIGVPFILFYIVTALFVPFQYRSPSIIYTLAISAFILAIWGLVENFTNSINISTKINKAIISVGRCSMGIYILHYWLLIYLLSSTSLHIFRIDQFIQKYQFLIILTIVLITFIFCDALTMVCRKNKYGRMILG